MAASGPLHCAESTRNDCAFTAKCKLLTFARALQLSLCASLASLATVREVLYGVIVIVVGLFYTIHIAASATTHHLLLGMVGEGDTEFSILKKEGYHYFSKYRSLECDDVINANYTNSWSVDDVHDIH